MVKVAPSILSADFSRLLEEVERMEKAGADWLHIDIMDGNFVPNITIGPMVVDALKGKTNLFLDVHLMVQHPEDFLEDFSRAGAQLLTVHLETCVHLHRVIQKINELGCSAGVALNPATPLNGLDYIMEDIQLVLFMSVNPGFGGQKFIPFTLEKIRKLAEEKEKRGWEFEIQVDGGINEETAPSVVYAGADILVAGSYLFNALEPKKSIEGLKRLSSGKE